MFIKKKSGSTDASAMFWLAASAIQPLPPWQLQQLLQQLELHQHKKRTSLTESGMLPGCSARVLNLSDQTEAWLTLVYPQQADPVRGFISVLSPLGAVLLGKNVGEVAQLRLLRRSMRFLLCDLMAVKHPPAFTFTPVQEKMMNPMLPELTLSSLDLDRLELLLRSLSASDPSRLALEPELNRATVLEPAAVPDNVVTMNSTIRLRLLKSGEEPCLTLVYPKDLDASGQKVSVLAPVGSAVLGLKEGDRIHWPMPDGDIQQIQVVQVLYQPERSGHLHR